MSLMNRMGCLFETVESRRMLSGDVGDLSVEVQESAIALLVPAVQAAREAPRQTSDTGHEGWIEVLSFSH